MPERLHKYLAHCGIASRRKAEEYILAGRVEVNGAPVTELGVQIEPGVDTIRFDGKPVREEKKVYYLLHKPRGVTTTSEDELGRKTVVDLLGADVTERVYPVGRLDRDSEGLLVLTNDGDLAWYLTHPSCGVHKTYHVVVEGTVTDGMMSDLVSKGARLGPDLIKPIAVKLLRRYPHSTSMHITVAEGVNREIRRLFAMLGHEVKKLLRLEIGPLKIQKLPRGQYRPLTRRELGTLFHGMERVGAAMDEPAPGGRGRKRKPVKKRQRTGKPDPAAHDAHGSRKPGAGRGTPHAKPSGKPSGKASGQSKRSHPARDAHTPGTKAPGRTDSPSESRNAAKPVHPFHASRPSGASSRPHASPVPRPGSGKPSHTPKPAGGVKGTETATSKGTASTRSGKGGGKGSGAWKGGGKPVSGASRPHGASKGHDGSKRSPAARTGTGKPSTPPYAGKASRPAHPSKPARPGKPSGTGRSPASSSPRPSGKSAPRHSPKSRSTKGRKR